MGSLQSGFCLVLLLLPLASSPQTANQRGDLLEERGLEALRQHHYQDALGAFEELLSIDPGRATAHHGKGLVYTGMLNYSAAVSSLEKAVSLDSNLAEAWRARGAVFPGSA